MGTLAIDTSTVLLSALLLVVLAAAGSMAYVTRAVIAYKNRPPSPAAEPSGTEQLEADFESLRKLVEDLTLALDDGIRRVDRAENRIQKTVASARSAVRKAGLEHAGIEAEFDQLEPANADGIEPLPTMPEIVEDARTIRIPGGHLTIGAG